jgi:hypothetical protein
MTKGELYKYEQRVKEINEVIDLCTEHDGDVLENLDKELCEIINRLEDSLREINNEEL